MAKDIADKAAMATVAPQPPPPSGETLDTLTADAHALIARIRAWVAYRDQQAAAVGSVLGELTSALRSLEPTSALGKKGSDLLNDIVGAVRTFGNQGASLQDIAKTLGMEHHEFLRPHVLRAKREGLLRVEGEKRGARWHVA